MNKFAERVRQLREEKGLSRKDVADALYVSTRLVGYWEMGERECNFDMLIKISKFFAVSTDYLLGK